MANDGGGPEFIGEPGISSEIIPNEVPRSLTQRTASGVAWITGFQVARQVLQVVSISVLARRVPPSAYGMVAMAALVTNFLETLRDAGIGTALVREREVSDELASTVFWLSCGLGVAVTLLVVIVSFPAAFFFHEPQVARILQFLSISFFLGAISLVPMAMLNRAMAFRKVAIAQTAGAIFGTTVAISVALAGGKVWALVSGSVALSLATTVAIWFSSPLKVRAVFRPSDARHMLSFGLNLSGFNVLNYFSRNLDNLLVGRFLGSVPLGLLPDGILADDLPAAEFRVCRLPKWYIPRCPKFHDDHERFRAAYIRACRIIALFTFPLMMGLAVTATAIRPCVPWREVDACRDFVAGSRAARCRPVDLYHCRFDLQHARETRPAVPLGYVRQPYLRPLIRGWIAVGNHRRSQLLRNRLDDTDGSCLPDPLPSGAAVGKDISSQPVAHDVDLSRDDCCFRRVVVWNSQCRR